MNRSKELSLRVGWAALALSTTMAIAPIASAAESPDTGNGNRLTLSEPVGCGCENPTLVGDTWVGFVGSGGFSHFQCECPEPRQLEQKTCDSGCENPTLVGDTWVGFVGSGGFSHFQRECPPPKPEKNKYFDSYGGRRGPRRGNGR